MTAAEQGFLLLTGFFGDPERKPLTVAQFRDLTLRARTMNKPLQNRELTPSDLTSIGCSKTFAERIVHLLSQQEQLDWYLREGKGSGCIPITRISEHYPESLHRYLGMEAPGALWAKGNTELLHTPMISLVGSRDLRQDNLTFAREVGKQAALQGITLVSGNARGADQAAQEACLEHGGNVISVVADELSAQPDRERILYLSEEGYDLPFSAHRALQRNRIIHVMGEKVFVAQCRLGKGGTWNGTQMNLRKGWRPVFCYADGSACAAELEQMGAVGVTTEALRSIEALQGPDITFMEL